jgi:polyphenol oxidase
LKREDLPIIKSDLLFLFPTICHGISTRKGGVSQIPYSLNLSYNVGDNKFNVLENREKFFGKLGINNSKIAFTKQIHSDVVRMVTKPGVYESCDALITREVELFLVITVADCLPIFLYDSVTQSIGAVHAGWRGSNSKILEKTLTAMNKQFGTQCKNIVAYLGPAASVCCYAVGEDVAERFDKKYVKSINEKHSLLDLKQVNKDILLKAGVSEKNIEVSEYCTICNSDLFHSYRRDKTKSGRMMAVIGMVKLPNQ